MHWANKLFATNVVITTKKKWKKMKIIFQQNLVQKT